MDEDTQEVEEAEGLWVPDAVPDDVRDTLTVEQGLTDTERLTVGLLVCESETVEQPEVDAVVD
jgi:hypothetical protein